MEEKSREYINCVLCGRRAAKTAPNRKYCRACAEKAKRGSRGRRRKSNLLDCHDLRGKSLARVDGEAKAFGLSYGMYTAAVYSGGIDALLREKGITDPAAVLREVRAR